MKVVFLASTLYLIPSAVLNQLLAIMTKSTFSQHGVTVNRAHSSLDYWERAPLLPRAPIHPAVSNREMFSNCQLFGVNQLLVH